MSRITTTENKSCLGSLIVMRLKELGVNQKWLAKNAYISQVYLCNILAGRANPTVKTLRKLSHSLDMDVKELVNAMLSDN